MVSAAIPRGEEGADWRMILQHKEVKIGEEIGIHESRILKVEPQYYTVRNEDTISAEPAGLEIWYYEVNNQ